MNFTTRSLSSVFLLATILAAGPTICGVAGVAGFLAITVGITSAAGFALMRRHRPS